ncbi:16S rRNA (cytidine(1402)-2'-O)-methyltransferase [Tumebacillus sp. ITR2]|uniref:Ribosomal RNA small subunit methyltransferase I n=1 Tax=Tumebacillus amylolyticus TaxID=2801339 RepID=A0ABS1JFL7_9BACL|nr:16S rRNA (cytidine(1402)-2'-O)-methyltransferase [Tumebacillus amylolyticus]MBL0389054.1 16S rRNA (cytidine(1402)-2'-O)-methyltransferase [Tumebacillus amylolyticus]
MTFQTRYSFQDQQETGTLYLVATPIGNLDDMTYRAVEILKSVEVVAAEDTRQSRKLLTHFGIEGVRLISYHEHNKHSKEEAILSLLREGQSVALVTDAGTPGISDPGADIVRAAVEERLTVVPIPGCVAGVTALIASGLPTDRFTFIGFLPREKKKRVEELTQLRARMETLIFYEAPHRLEETLKAMLDVLGDREIVLAKELTKRYEQFSRGKISEVIFWLSENEPRGEYVLVLEGLAKELANEFVEKPYWEELNLSEHVEKLVESGLSKKDAVKQVAKERGLQKREVYNEVMVD